MTRYIHEPEKEIPVKEKCSVVVVGGGIAGISAALSAAREGADVLLIEKQYNLGGLATLGLIAIYLPLCDGNGKQVSFGIAEELMKLSTSTEANPYTRQRWMEEKKLRRLNEELPRYMCRYNPSVFSVLSEKLLINENVRILYGVRICGASLEKGCIKALFAEGSNGRFAIEADVVIDASGDAAVCRLAGEKTVAFKQENILAGWYYYITDGEYRLQTLGAADIPDAYKKEEKLMDHRKRYSGTDYRNISDFVIDSHTMLWDDYKKKCSVSDNCQLATIPTIPQLRMTTRIIGKTELREDDSCFMEDSVGMIGNWKTRGPIYEIPFSCLHGNSVTNLFVAGRCISTDDTAWDVTRVIPACAVTGEATGVAAALMQNSIHPDIEKIQNVLRERKIPLHVNELKMNVCFKHLL